MESGAVRVEASSTFREEAVGLVVLTPAIAAIVTTPVLGPYALIAAAIALVSAVVVAVPALWLVERITRPGPIVLTLPGTLAGGVPFGAVIGLFLLAYGDVDRVFWTYQWLATAIGTATGAADWAIFSWHARSGWHVVGLVGLVVMLALTAMLWPVTWWPKQRVVREQLDVEWAIEPDAAAAGLVRLWRPDRPDCVASVRLPALAAHLETTGWSSIELEIARTTTMGRGTHVSLRRAGPVPVPSGLPLTSCVLWC